MHMNKANTHNFMMELAVLIIEMSLILATHIYNQRWISHVPLSSTFIAAQVI